MVCSATGSRCLPHLAAVPLPPFSECAASWCRSPPYHCTLASPPRRSATLDRAARRVATTLLSPMLARALGSTAGGAACGGAAAAAPRELPRAGGLVTRAAHFLRGLSGASLAPAQLRAFSLLRRAGARRTAMARGVSAVAAPAEVWAAAGGAWACVPEPLDVFLGGIISRAQAGSHMCVGACSPELRLVRCPRTSPDAPHHHRATLLCCCSPPTAGSGEACGAEAARLHACGGAVRVGVRLAGTSHSRAGDVRRSSRSVRVCTRARPPVALLGRIALGIA